MNDRPLFASREETPEDFRPMKGIAWALITGLALIWIPLMLLVAWWVNS